MTSTVEAIVKCKDLTMDAYKDLETQWVETKHKLAQLMVGKNLDKMSEEEREELKKALEDSMKIDSQLKDFLVSKIDASKTALLEMADGVQRRNAPGRQNTGDTASADSGFVPSTTSIIAQPEDSVSDETESHA